MEAYEAKKWAFVSDYARFKILHEFGGLYFDTDVEVIKPLDEILQNGSFMGFEQGKKTIAGYDYQVNPGVGLAAEPGLPLYAEVLDHYHGIHFLTESGGQNTTTVVEHTTKILKRYGMKNVAKIQQVAGVTLYPPEYFCPLNFNTGVLNITPNTYTIHHFAASWFSKWDWALVHIERTFADKGLVMLWIGWLVALPIRIIRKIKNIGFVAAVKLAIQKCLRKEKV